MKNFFRLLIALLVFLPLLIYTLISVAKITAATAAPTCSITSNQDGSNPYLFHTSLNWNNAYNIWHLFYWGDEAQTGKGPVGYFGSSGTASWDHVYNYGTWQQWTIVVGSGGATGCLVTITLEKPPAPTCSIETSVNSIDPTYYHSTITWNNTYKDWNLFHWGDEAVTGSDPVGFWGESGSIGFDHSYPIGTWQQWASLNGPGGTGNCAKSVTIATPPAPTCTIQTQADGTNPQLYHSTVTWNNAIDWNLFHWGDEVITGNDPVGFWGESGSLTWDHLYNPGVWEQWVDIKGPGGSGSCLKTIEVSEPTPPPAPTCSIVSAPYEGNSYLYRSTVTWDNTYEDWSLFYWGDEEFTHVDPVGYFGESGTMSWDHEYDPGSWEQWTNIQGPGGYTACRLSVTVN